MRDLVLTLFIPLSLLWGLTKPRRALIVMAWICFMRPYDFSWGMWNTLPTFKIALAFAMLSALIHGGFKFKFHPFLGVYLAFLAWAGIGSYFAFNTRYAQDFYKTYLLSFWVVSVFLFGTLFNLTTLKWVLFTSAASLALVGAKVGYVLGAKGGGHITDQINGFVGDNNVFGITLVLAISTAMGMRNIFAQKKWRYFVIFIIVGAVLAVVFTKSRGAFLSTALIFILSAFSSRKPIRNSVILVVVAVAAYSVIPRSFFDRLDTFQNIEADDSAMHRIQYWGFGLKMAADRPVFGVGLDNFKTYTDNHFQTELQGRYSQVAHSVYIQILAEMGYPGLILYLVMALWTLLALHRVKLRAKHIKKKYPDLAWVETTAFWMRNGWFGYMFGSAFLNMLVLDFPWYFMWYAQLLGPAFSAELKRRKRIAEAERKERDEEEEIGETAGSEPEADHSS